MQDNKIAHKHFGKISTVVYITVLLCISFVFKTNLTYIELLENLPFIIWIVIVLIIFMLIFFIRNIERLYVNLLYVLCIGISWSFLNSMFHSAAISSIPKDQSLSDQNAASNLTWIIIIPTVSIILFVLGVIFDFLMRWRQK